MYEDSVKLIIRFTKNETLLTNEKLMTVFQTLINDYEGLKAGGLFD